MRQLQRHQRLSIYFSSAQLILISIGTLLISFFVPTRRYQKTFLCEKAMFCLVLLEIVLKSLQILCVPVSCLLMRSFFKLCLLNTEFTSIFQVQLKIIALKAKLNATVKEKQNNPYKIDQHMNILYPWLLILKKVVLMGIL